MDQGGGGGEWARAHCVPWIKGEGGGVEVIVHHGSRGRGGVEVIVHHGSRGGGGGERAGAHCAPWIKGEGGGRGHCAPWGGGGRRKGWSSLCTMDQGGGVG